MTCPGGPARIRSVRPVRAVWGRMLHRAITLRVPLVLGALCLLIAACAGTDAERPVEPAYDLHHPDGVRRARAIQTVVAQGDRRWVTDLIELLDDDDEIVRLQAGAGLKQLTGHDTGYAPFLSRSARRTHIERWRAWWATQEQQRGKDDAPAADGTGVSGGEVR